MPLGHLTTTYQHIADILSFEVPTDVLEATLNQDHFDWDAIVVEGSKHLVLPALYCRLKAKNLLHCLPDELKAYLEELTSINRNRNVAILKQVNTISDLLQKHHISHVFLKGSALLALGVFEDLGERMVGDIDILIEKSQIEISRDILLANGYIESEPPLREQFEKHFHLPRLTSKNYLSAVELHHKLFKTYFDDDLSTKNILDHKLNMNEVYIPSVTHILKHNILAYQINDNGYYYNSISFKSGYDTIRIQRQHDISLDYFAGKIIKQYLNLLALFFVDLRQNYNYQSNFITNFYVFKLKHLRFYKSWNKLLSLVNYSIVIFNRALLFLKTKSYRKAIIRDRNRVYKNFITVIKKK
jgi:hypothetical protein